MTWLARCLIAGGAVSLVLAAPAPEPAGAVIEQMYTFPFWGAYNLSCGFHCYYDPELGWHEGVDYELGVPGQGEGVYAAARGTAKNCGFDSVAGWYIVLDHGHRTRYLHLNSQATPGNGQSVGRGVIIGIEGSSGYTDPPGFVHLHFETRHGATTFTCGKDGTAVDPYGVETPGTYMWRSNPPAYAHGAADRTVWRPATGTWHIQYYAGGGASIQWGQNGDTPVPADYTGDGKDDPAVFRTVGSVKKWFVYGGVWDLQWGDVGDTAVPCDYTGDGRADYAVFRTIGDFTYWYVYGGVYGQRWGERYDVPVPADYTGDGVCDIAAWRPSNGTWYVLNGSTQQWGQNGDRPVPSDFNCDGTPNFTVYRSTGGPLYLAYWYVHGGVWALPWGELGDVALSRDYDGSCDANYGVWRPSNATWYVHNLYNIQWGQTTDYAVPVDYDGR